MAQKIVPCLWFDNNAEEAVKFYVSLFPKSKAGRTDRFDAQMAEASGQPEGSVMFILFRLAGQEFSAINGGSYYKHTPAVSFFVSCKTEKELDSLWAKLSEGGSTLMELQEYPFAKKYGWLNDKYGVSWQLLLEGRNIGARKQKKITPALMFVGKQDGKSEEAMKLYASLFPKSKIKSVARYGKDEGGTVGNIKHAVFSLAGQEFIAFDGGTMHPFTFTGAVSFFVNCRTQGEIDKYWSAFSRGGEPLPCGWVADKYGVHWQVVPEALDRWMHDRNSAKAARATAAMLGMKKLDLAKLKAAYLGKP